MRHSLVRRLGAVTGGLVVAGGLAIVPAGSANAVVPDTAATETAGWIADQLTDGLIFNDQFSFNDIGLTVDAAVALDALGDDATVTAIATAVSAPATLADYVGDGTVESYAGSLAKASVLAGLAGEDPTDFGGIDLIARLEGRVGGSGATAGRIADLSEFGDFANVVGQSYAVEALDAAGSDKTDAATDFLLAQQCAAGYFRLNFSAAAAPDQTCDGAVAADKQPDTDATAFAILALQSQADDTDVSSEISDAIAWLRSTQKADGSFGGGTSTEASNSNSTGLAAWAFAQSNVDCAAARAAAWVLDNRVTDPAVSSPLADDEGAIAYDAAGLTAGQANGITTLTQDQWRRATFQAAPALTTLLDEAPNAKLTGPKGYVQAGTSPKLTLSGLATGEQVCIFGPGVPARVVTGTGAAVSFPVAAGTATAKRSYALEKQSSATITSFQVLGQQALKIKLKKQVAVDGKQVITVSKLAPREEFELTVDGTSSAHGVAGQASAKGIVKFVLKVKEKGRYKVKVVGEFGNRRGSAVFRVTR
jgi:hypothetical protein